MIFDPSYALSILPRLLGATQVTIVATLFGTTIALLLGLVIAVAKYSGIRLISWPATAYVEFIRGTPLLIQLYFLFFVLPLFGPRLGALLTGIIGLGLNYATYTAEVYRAGIEGVGTGQWEAARALGLGTGRTWRAIILPQAIPPIVAPLGNYFIGMFKDSALLFTISVVELFGAALSIGGDRYRYFEPILLSGLIYLAVSYPSALIIARIDRRLGGRAF